MKNLFNLTSDYVYIEYWVTIHNVSKKGAEVHLKSGVIFMNWIVKFRKL